MSQLEPPPAALPSGGLPLTVFEEHMLADDRPTHPMVIAMRLDFSGGPAPAALAAAFAATVEREPLLAARVAGRRFVRPRWFVAQRPQLVFSSIAHALAADDGWIGMPPRLDPRAGPMLHAEVVSRPDGWTLLLAVHHAAADGLGIIGFVERWLAATHGASAPESRSGAPLAARGRIADSWTGFLRMLPRLAIGLQGVRQFVTRRVISLRGRDVAGQQAAAGPWQPTVIAATLEPAGTQIVAARARSLGVTVNDLLVSALVSAVGSTPDPAAASRSAGWVRIGVPMSLRAKREEPWPAMNRVSMVFVDRRPEDRHDPAALARGIRTEMDLIRSHGLRFIFPLSLEAGRLLPGGLERMAERPEPQCTAVLSNLGRCFSRSPLRGQDGRIGVGESKLDGWWIVPPVRPGTAVAVGTHETEGRRTIAMNLDPARLSAADARHLLDRLLSELQGRPA